MVSFADPAASFEVETPSATAFVRGTTPRVEVAADGTTRVANVPDGTESLVVVIGKDPNNSQVSLRPGEGTSIAPGLAPIAPAPVSNLGLGLGGLTSAQQQAQDTQQERQERHAAEQTRAEQQAEQARLGLVAAQAELARLTEQENRLLREVAVALTPTPTALPKGVGPNNDVIAGATRVEAVPAQFQQSTVGAATEGGENINPCAPIGKTVWFSFMAPAAGGLAIDTAGSSFDTVLAVYTGTAPNNLTLVACNDDSNQSGAGNITNSRVVIATTPGTTYFVQAGGFAGSSGNLVVNFRPAAPPPPNDLFARAATVNPTSGTQTVNTESATTEPGEPVRVSCGGFTRTIGNTVWYTFTPSATTPVSIDTFQSSFDTILVVYSGTALNNLQQVRCNDDSSGGLQSRVSFAARAGTTYYVQVGGFVGAFGNLMVNFGPGLPVPANDDFANAVAIGALPARLTAVTDSASIEPGESTSFTCDGAQATVDNTVWYTLTPTATGFVALDTFGSNYDTVLAVSAGAALAGLTPLVCNDNTTQPGTGSVVQSRVTFNAVSGTPYRIQVGGFRGSFGNLVLNAAATTPPSANDLFANATVIAPGSLPTTNTVSTNSNTTEPGEPTLLVCNTFSVPITNTAWYAFTPMASGALVVDTFGSAFDTLVTVYTGSAVNALTQVACNDNATQPGTANLRQSRVVATVTAGTTYWVQIGGVRGVFGSLTTRFAFGPPPPANDNFANAQSVTTLPSTFGPIDTTTASVDPDERTTTTPCPSVPIGNTVWYTFTPAATTPVTVDTIGSNFDTVLAVYTGSALNALTGVACNDDAVGVQSRVSLVAGAGTTYSIQVGGYNSAFGNLQVRFQQTPPPPNDNFANAQAASPGTVTLSTLAATTEPGEPLTVDGSCAPTTGGTLGATVWYTVTPTGPTQVTLNTFGSDFDTVLAVYTGSQLNALSRVVCNDDAQGTQSQVSFAAQAGVPYRVQVGGFNGAAGNLTVTFSQSPGPGLPRGAPATPAPPPKLGPTPAPPAAPAPALADKPAPPGKQRPTPGPAR